jgi:hypothetical protein
MRPREGEMSKPISDYERDLLRHLNGEDVPGLSWGAAMGAAIEFLRSDGLVEGYTDIRITDAGRAAIAAAKGE